MLNPKSLRVSDPARYRVVWAHLSVSAQLRGWLWGIMQKRRWVNFSQTSFLTGKIFLQASRQWVLICPVNAMAVRFMTTSLITPIDKELPQNSLISRQTWFLCNIVRYTLRAKRVHLRQGCCFFYPLISIGADPRSLWMVASFYVLQDRTEGES